MQNAVTAKARSGDEPVTPRRMTSARQYVTSYVRERLSPIPWLVIPAFLFVMASAQLPSERTLLFAWLYLAVAFFRALDDLLCWEHDQAQGKPAAYLQSSQTPLFVLVSLLSAALLMFSLLALSATAQDQFAAFLVVVVPIYLALRHSSSVVYVSLLKYPALLYVIASQTGTSPLVWPLLACAFFVIREVLEESFGKRSAAIELLVGAALVASKAILSFP